MNNTLYNIMAFVIGSLRKSGNGYVCTVPTSEVRRHLLEYLFSTVKSVPVKIHFTKRGVFINLANPELKGQQKAKFIEMHRKERELLEEMLTPEPE